MDYLLDPKSKIFEYVDIREFRKIFEQDLTLNYFSKFIFAPDLPYAREVLSSYFKVVFCDHRIELDWVKALKRYSVNKEAIDGATVAPFKMDSNWEDFFKLLD